MDQCFPWNLRRMIRIFKEIASLQRGFGAEWSLENEGTFSIYTGNGGGYLSDPDPAACTV